LVDGLAALYNLGVYIIIESDHFPAGAVQVEEWQAAAPVLPGGSSAGTPRGGMLYLRTSSIYPIGEPPSV
jgi:hypothetical protein